MDEAHDPRARQPELAGATRAQHQVGNDHIKGMAFNDGYTQFWSQDRLAQWANRLQPEAGHFSGGYGYLNTGHRVISMLYLDRPKDASYDRYFGVGYYQRRLRTAETAVTETTYAPFGDDPVLLDDVTITNTTTATSASSWFEYWDVNPYDQTHQQAISVAPPTHDPNTGILAAAQLTTPEGDTRPLSIFAAPLAVQQSRQSIGYETSLDHFFGPSKNRQVPAEVAADRLSGATGTATGSLFAFRVPVTLAPGASTTLRFVYGMAHPSQITALVDRYRQAQDPLQASEKSWSAWLPQADFGASEDWVARELRWDAYLLRSSSVYEEQCGWHTVTQGGYYQYDLGLNISARNWLHYAMPLTYTDPSMARDVISYAVHQQQSGTHQLPYGTGPLCTRDNATGTPGDLDFWLLMAAEEYGLATHDTHYFDQQVPYSDGRTTASVWDHLKVAFDHQESLLGPHGDYLVGGMGDWNDSSAQFEQMTESTLITAQLAYVYPLVADLADLRGDTAFAAKASEAGARDLATLRAEWSSNGWYDRGYQGASRFGVGVIFEEPQPWAILAGAPDDQQTTQLLDAIQRFLTNNDTAQPALVPSRTDPGVKERGAPYVLAGLLGLLLPSSPVQGASAWPGGAWFDPNGWLTWAYATLGTREATAKAWSTYLADTLAAHATRWPDHWNGIISVDDVCNPWYSAHPANCTTGLTTNYDGQVTEQPAWMVMDALRLAGVTPTEAGYDITPHLPMTTYSLNFPSVGLAANATTIQGRLTLPSTSTLVMRVAPTTTRPYAVLANGRNVKFTYQNGLVTFPLHTAAGQPATWAVHSRN